MKRTFETQLDLPGIEAENLAAWHDRPGAFQRLAPPWEDVKVLSNPVASATIPGSELTIRIKIGPVPIRWVASISPSSEEDTLGFVDRQKTGPFAY